MANVEPTERATRRAAGELSVRLFIRIVEPPQGVRFAVQNGKAELTQPRWSRPEAISFEIALRLRPTPDGAGFVFAGEFAQGPPHDRFVYVNSGVRAGQAGTAWDRRAKLKLDQIPDTLLRAAAGDGETAVEASFGGSADDGGPVCASLPASAVQWRLVRPAG